MVHPGSLVGIFFIYGLAFFAMGLAIALESRRPSTLPMAASLKYLAAFAILHSFVEWLDMFLLMPDIRLVDETLVRVLRTVLLVSSTLILIWFGVHLLTTLRPHLGWLQLAPGTLLALWLAAALAPQLAWQAPAIQAADVGGCLPCHWEESGSYLALRGAWLSGADIWARYLLYLPGNLLAAGAVLAQRRWFQAVGFRQGARDCGWAAVAFILNAWVAGLIVPPGPYPLANVLNYANFYEWLGVPPQVLRALAALLIAFFIVRILRTFEVERRGQLERAYQERYEAQQQALVAQDQVHRQLEEWSLRLEDLVLRRTREVEQRNREVAILEERDRLAREMHDSLGQVLSYLSLRLMTTEQLLAEGQAEEARAALGKMEAAVEAAVADVRQSILSLRTGPEGGLVPALHEYLAKFGDLAGLQTEVAVADGEDLPLDPVAQLQLLRIVQEALTNVRKHAQASRARLTLERQGDGIVVMVEDDGKGFDPQAVKRDRGQRFGLLTMEERAQAIGGVLRVDSASGQGTRVTLRVPLGKASLPQDQTAADPALGGPGKEERDATDTVRPIGG